MSEPYSNTLIPFETRTIGDEAIPTVDGRRLHTFLGIAKDYSNWVKAQIKRGHFIDGRDYTISRYYETRANPHAQKGEQEKQILTAIEYYFTFDAAKHIGMLSGSAKGHEVREHFIACEKAIHAQYKTLSDPLANYPELRAIRELIVATAEAKDVATAARLEAQEAKVFAARAETKADMALADAHRMTIEEFILVNGLIRQFPYSKHAEYARWLGRFCNDYGQDVRKAPVLGKSWDNELAYPLQALAAWLRYEQRRPQQITLVQETS